MSVYKKFSELLKQELEQYKQQPDVKADDIKRKKTAVELCLVVADDTCMRKLLRVKLPVLPWFDGSEVSYESMEKTLQTLSILAEHKIVDQARHYELHYSSFDNEAFGSLLRLRAKMWHEFFNRENPENERTGRVLEYACIEFEIITQQEFDAWYSKEQIAALLGKKPILTYIRDSCRAMDPLDALHDAANEIIIENGGIAPRELSMAVAKKALRELDNVTADIDKQYREIYDLCMELVNGRMLTGTQYYKLLHCGENMLLRTLDAQKMRQEKKLLIYRKWRQNHSSMFDDWAFDALNKFSASQQLDIPIPEIYCVAGTDGFYPRPAWFASREEADLYAKQNSKYPYCIRTQDEYFVWQAQTSFKGEE